MPMEKEATPAETRKRRRVRSRRAWFFLELPWSAGAATAVVLATGKQTAFGEIAERLAMRPPETEFQRGIRQFALLIMRAVFFLVLFIVDREHCAAP